MQNVRSLYSLCLNETSKLLQCDYWDVNCTISNNPFHALESNVIHDLFALVTSRRTVKETNLHLILTSGRITEFKLTNMTFELGDVEDIFTDLKASNSKLESIKIRNVVSQRGQLESYSLGVLIRSSSQLVYLESCIFFNLKCLAYCVNLENLVLNFEFDNICTILEIYNEICFNNSLRVLRLPENRRNPFFYIDIAKILHCCVELIEINCDVARSIEYLHNIRAINPYKLQRCLLGDSGPLDLLVTVNGVLIVSVACPNLRIVEITPEDNLAVMALSYFQHIISLTLNKPSNSSANYRLGIHLLLNISEFGRNLTFLHIINFSGVDFSSIGEYCPNLEVLKAEISSEDNRSQFLPTSFKKLISLYVENVSGEPLQSCSLVGLLSNASDLEFLTINNGELFNDSVLYEILKANKFSKLNSLTIYSWGISISGLQHLAANAGALQCMYVNSLTIRLEDAARILGNIHFERFNWTCSMEVEENLS